MIGIIVRFMTGVFLAGSGLALSVGLFLLLKSQLTKVLSYSVICRVLLTLSALSALFPFATLAIPWRHAAALENLWWSFPLWVVGIAALTLVIIIGKGKQKRNLQIWQEAFPQDDAHQALKRLSEELDAGGISSLQYSPVVQSPVASSSDGAQSLVLPFSNYTPQELNFTLRRALWGIKCREGLCHHLALCAAIFHWCNPMAWVLYVQIASALSCSVEQRLLSEFSQKEQRDYTEFAARSMAAGQDVSTAPLIPGFCRKWLIRQRFRALFSPTPQNKTGLAFTASLLGLLLFMGVTALGGYVFTGTQILTTAPASASSESDVPPASISSGESSSASSASSTDSAVSDPLSNAVSASEQNTDMTDMPQTLTLPEYPAFPQEVQESLQDALSSTASAAESLAEAVIAIQAQPPTPAYDKPNSTIPPKEVVTPVLENIFAQYRAGTVDTTAESPRMMAAPFDTADLPETIDPQAYYITVRGENGYAIVVSLETGWAVHIWLDDVGDEVTYDLQPAAASFAQE